MKRRARSASTKAGGPVRSSATGELGLVLGRGAMGEVYEAVGPTASPAAIKLLNARVDGDQSCDRRALPSRDGRRGAPRVAAHRAACIEVSTPDAPVPYIAMERLHGVDLATRLRNETEPHAVRRASSCCSIKSRAVSRSRGSPASCIAISSRTTCSMHDGSVWKILDFGVSKRDRQRGHADRRRQSSARRSTWRPSRRRAGTVDALADVYALGAIAYRCLTGRSPFKGKDLAELVYQVVHTPPVRPSLLGRVSQPIEDVLAVAMAKDPRRRFPSAMSFAQAFIAARRGRKVAIDIPDNAWLL